ncbi:MAG: amidohydrolase family protein [Acidobacteriota bacterium]
MTVIDFHNHFYPPEYLEALRTGGSNFETTFDSEGNPLLHYPGDYNIIVRGHRDIGFRKTVLAGAGIDKQVLTFTSPGTQIEAPDRAIELASLVNDALAGIQQEHGERFTVLGTLPMNASQAAVGELERAVTDLGMKGFMLFSNVNGVSLTDRRYWPLYEVAEELETVFYIHPIYPVGVQTMTEYWLMPLVGFAFDTTLAAAKLVFSGTVERFPGIRWVLAHLGGAIPYLAERLDRGYHAFQECRKNISRPPSEYLKEFFYDTVNFDPGALRLAIDFAGAHHLLAGSDYPHQIGSLPRMLESIDCLGLDREAKESILGGNAARLLNIPS